MVIEFWDWKNGSCWQGKVGKKETIVGRKQPNQYQRILEADATKQAEMKEKNNIRVPQKNFSKPFSETEISSKEGSTWPTLLKMNKTWTQTNRPKDKKIDNDALRPTSKRMR